MLPPLVKGPGRDEVVLETSGFSLRSLPELLRLLWGGGGKEWEGFFIYQKELREARILRASLTSQVFFWSQSLNSVVGRRVAET